MKKSALTMPQGDFLERKEKEERVNPTYVMKFGGSSLGGPDEFLQCVSIIKQYSQDDKSSSLVLVCSAMGDTTDHLLKTIELAKSNDYDKARSLLSEIKQSHALVVSKTIPDSDFQKQAISFVDSKFAELEKILYGISLIRDISSRTLDYVLSFGEQLSTFIMSALLSSLGIKTEYLTGGQAGIVTDDSFGSAEPVMKNTVENLRKKLLTLLSANVTPVVTGFIAETLHTKEMITLGRGGSDYTASLIATAIDSDEVFLWTDVDGIMTSDPKIVKDARIVRQITYLEAMEMSAFGAKAMQPRALEPVARAEIPVRIKNTFAPKGEGTLIVSPNRVKNGYNSGIKCIGSLTNVALVTISGARIVGQPGTALAIFNILKELGVSLLMISQSVSESNVSLVIKKDGLPKIIRTLRERLLQVEEAEDQYSDSLSSALAEPLIVTNSMRNQKNSVFAKVEFEDDVAVIGVLGKGMIGIPGIAGRVFSTVAKQGINIRMIAQGSSEINISFVIKEKDRARAVLALHEEFSLGAPSVNDDEGESEQENEILSPTAAATTTAKKKTK